jgi:hypothetical protein
MKAMKTEEQKQWIADLTQENAKNVATIINKNNPEWGIKAFQYNGQALTGGRYSHTWGVGSNSAVMDSDEMKFWAVVSFKYMDVSQYAQMEIE